MKGLIFLLTIFCFSFCYTQVGIDTAEPHKSALLEMYSKEKGFLMPRLSSKDVLNPVEGLQLYDTDEDCLMIFSNQEWNCFPQNIFLDTQVAAVLKFNDISNIGGSETAEAFSNGVEIQYNPNGVLERLADGNVKFLSSSKFEMIMVGTVTRQQGFNVIQSISFENNENALNNIKCVREAPGAYPSNINYFCKNLVEVSLDDIFRLKYNKISQGTDNTTSIRVVNPLVIIKYIDL